MERNSDSKIFGLEDLTDKVSGQFLKCVWNTTPNQMCLAQMVYGEDGSPGDYIILDLNPSLEKVLGFARDQAVNQRVTELFPYCDPKWIEKCGEAVRSCQTLISVEHTSEPDIWNEVQILPLNWENQFITIAQDITARKKMEADLREGEEKYRDLFENEARLEQLVEERTREMEEAILQKVDLLESISDCFYSLDNELRFTYVNKSAEQGWGLSRAELVGKKIEEVFPDIIDISLGKFRQVLKEKSPQHYELFSHVINRWVYMSVYPTTDGISVFWQDINDLKETQLRLQKSQQDISDILASIKDPFFTLDGNWNFTYINQTGQEQFAHFGSFIGQNIWDTFPKMVGGISWDKYHEVMKSMESLCFEAKTEYTGFWSQVSVYPLAEGVSVLFQDITARKQAEEDLRASEERFYKVFHNSPDMIGIVNSAGVFIDVNQKFLDILEYSREEVLGHSIDELNLRVDEPSYIDPLYNQLLEKRAIDNIESRIRTKSGKIITILSSVVLIEIKGEMCIVSNFKDITKEREMDANMARLDRLNLVGEMAASIGHEIRNPMTSIRGLLQMLGEKDLYDEDRLYFELMIEELDRANEIISEYLGMAKDKKVNLQYQYLDDLIKSIYPIIESDANHREINVRLELNKPPKLIIDGSEIRQLILNMVRNSFESMTSNGTLTIGTLYEDNEIVLSIKDEGTGLPPEIINKVGTPFVTTKENGTGLGLSICYSIAARHNARINYITGPDGTTFYISFPLLVEYDKE